MSPTDLARRAHANGVELWALTDHDETGGIAEGQGQRLGKAHVEFAADVKVGHGLLVGQAAGIKAALGGRAKAGVERILDPVVEGVAPERERAVHVPFARCGAQTGGEGHVGQV